MVKYLQWVAYALQKMSLDIKNNDRVTKNLIRNVKSVSGSNNLSILAIGCDYVERFILSFAIELVLESLILKEGKII